MVTAGNTQQFVGFGDEVGQGKLILLHPMSEANTDTNADTNTGTSTFTNTDTKTVKTHV